MKVIHYPLHEGRHYRRNPYMMGEIMPTLLCINSCCCLVDSTPSPPVVLVALRKRRLPHGPWPCRWRHLTDILVQCNDHEHYQLRNPCVRLSRMRIYIYWYFVFCRPPLLPISSLQHICLFGRKCGLELVPTALLLLVVFQREGNNWLLYKKPYNEAPGGTCEISIDEVRLEEGHGK